MEDGFEFIIIAQPCIGFGIGHLVENPDDWSGNILEIGIDDESVIGDAHICWVYAA